MFCLVLFLTCVFVTLTFGLMASVSDFRGMTIPNMYSAAIIISFALAWAVLAVLGKGELLAPWWSHLLSALIIFAITAGLFAIGMLGAADSKLASAFALWTGMGSLPVFLVYMAISGGLLGATALYIKKKKPFKAPKEGSWPAQLQNGANKVPYGAAISFGALIAFFHAGFFSPATLSGFLN